MVADRARGPPAGRWRAGCELRVLARTARPPDRAAVGASAPGLGRMFYLTSSTVAATLRRRNGPRGRLRGASSPSRPGNPWPSKSGHTPADPFIRCPERPCLEVAPGSRRQGPISKRRGRALPAPGRCGEHLPLGRAGHQLRPEARDRQPYLQVRSCWRARLADGPGTVIMASCPAIRHPRDLLLMPAALMDLPDPAKVINLLYRCGPRPVRLRRSLYPGFWAGSPPSTTPWTGARRAGSRLRAADRDLAAGSRVSLSACRAPGTCRGISSRRGQAGWAALFHRVYRIDLAGV